MSVSISPESAIVHFNYQDPDGRYQILFPNRYYGAIPSCDEWMMYLRRTASVAPDEMPQELRFVWYGERGEDQRWWFEQVHAGIYDRPSDEGNEIYSRVYDLWGRVNEPPLIWWVEHIFEVPNDQWWPSVARRFVQLSMSDIAFVAIAIAMYNDVYRANRGVRVTLRDYFEQLAMNTRPNINVLIDPNVPRTVSFAGRGRLSTSETSSTMSMNDLELDSFETDGDFQEYTGQ